MALFGSGSFNYRALVKIVFKSACAAKLILVYLFCNIFLSNALAEGEPSDVRALVYSSTAAELQWSRVESELVQVTYNGNVVATIDADSYFVDSLDPAVFHRFGLSSLLADETRSDEVALSFSTANFQPPVREVLPQTGGAGSSALLSAVKLVAYSNSAVELFWNRAESEVISVEVFHNDFSQGVLDASSFYIDGLSTDREHVFKISPVSDNAQPGESYTVYFNPAAFAGQVTEVSATYQQMVEDTQSSPGSNVLASNDSSSVDEQSGEPEPETTASVTVPTTASAPPPPAPEQPSDDDATVVTTQSSIQAGDCVVRSLSDLNGCADAAQGLDRINIQADLSCTSANCCPTGGALMRFDNVSDLTIVGNGHQLLRQGGQRQCSLLDVTNSRNITLENWTLDDDARVAPCVVDDKCPRMLHIRTSSNIKLNNVTIDNGKSYVVYVQQVNGFEFTNSTLKNSGVLGMYIGHDDKASTNIKIQNSTFLDNQTNGLALLGVTGSSTGTNIVSNNEFRRNHWRGQWQVAPRYGTGFTGGGQMYIAQASGLTIRDNLIADGYCENCFIQSTMGSGVSGIELAIPGRESVSNTLITNNTVRNHDAWGIFVNQGSTLNSSVVISNNQLIDNTVGLKPGAASVSGNTVNNR